MVDTTGDLDLTIAAATYGDPHTWEQFVDVVRGAYATCPPRAGDLARLRAAAAKYCTEPDKCTDHALASLIPSRRRRQP